MSVGIITGSGTYALARLRGGASAVGRDAVRPGDGDPGQLSPGSRRSTSRATCAGHVRLSNHVTHRANIWALKRARAPVP